MRKEEPLKTQVELKDQFGRKVPEDLVGFPNASCFLTFEEVQFLIESDWYEVDEWPLTSRSNLDCLELTPTELEDIEVEITDETEIKYVDRKFRQYSEEEGFFTV